MSDIGYFSTYARFETESKEDAAAFLGADNIIGDAFSIEQEYVDGKRTAWIVNPFGKRMGTIDEKTAEKVDLCNAKGWNTVALLALVAFTEKPEPGLYWGQVLIISYDPEYEVAFSTFIENVGKQLGEGIRPDVSLGRDSLKKVVERTCTLPQQEQGHRLGKNAAHWNGAFGKASAQGKHGLHGN